MAIIRSAKIGSGIFVFISKSYYKLNFFGGVQGIKAYRLIHLAHLFTGSLSRVLELYSLMRFIISFSSNSVLKAIVIKLMNTELVYSIL